MKVLMRETYKGRVEHVGEKTCGVVYEVNGSLVEQTYEKIQFVDGKLPNLGDRVVVRVMVTRDDTPIPEPEDVEEKPSYRRPLTGPEEI